ncbi:MAG: hypothetical protein WC845_00305 [Candidatus Staskawiczbacteria bacterium]
MSKRNIVISFFVLLFVVAYFFVYNNPSQNMSADILKTTDAEIIKLLKTNTDSAEYMNKYVDFKIGEKTLLNKDSISAGQNGQNFQEVYQGLELEDNRYLRVDLMNSAGDWGLITVLDFKTKTVTKAFGLMLIDASAGIK